MKTIPSMLHTAVALLLAPLCSAADDATAVRAMQAAREATVAMEGNDFAAAIEKLEHAVELRPDFPQLWLDLAHAQVAAERLDEAVATLGAYAKLGLYSAIERMDEFAPLKGRKDFQEVTKRVAANLHPKGSGEIAFTLRDVTGLIEGIAWREKTGEFYFSDVHRRAVWTRNKDGTLKRFTPEGDGLFGVFGLAVDEGSGTLWAATSAVSAMQGFSPELEGEAALAAIDLESGEVRRTMPVPRISGGEGVHVLRDLAIAPDGSVYVADSGLPIVWRLAPGGQALEEFAQGTEIFALQGIAVLPDGAAVLADQINGILRTDPTGGSVMRLDPPPHATLIEIKGLAVSPGGQVLALQTDLRPSRVLSLDLDPLGESIAQVTVLESGHITMGAPSLGCIGPAGDFHFIGNAGWSRFAIEAQPTAPRQVPVFRTKLPGSKK